MLAGCLYRRASGRTVLDLSTRTQVKKPPLKLEAFLMIFGRSITLLPLPTLLTFKESRRYALFYLFTMIYRTT